MEQRVYQGTIRPEDLVDVLLAEWDRDDTTAQAFSEPGRAIVQIGQREGSWFGDEPHQAITLDIESTDDGVQVTMGQQQWIKDNGMQIFAGGLIGFFPFFFTFPLGQFFGGGEIDQSLPGRIWQTIDRYAANVGTAPATGKTQRLATIPCPECGVANPMAAERCSACGANLAPSSACANCGHVNPPGASFCNRCGSPLTTDH